MHKIFSFVTAALVLLLAACNQNVQKPQVKTRYYVHQQHMVAPEMHMDTTTTYGGLTDTYTYNDKGEIIATTSSDGSKTTNTQTGNTLVSITTDAKGNVLSKKTSFLNDKDKTDSFFVEQGGKVISARRILYDAEGNSIEEREYHPGPINGQLRLATTYHYNFKDGNVISETFTIPSTIDTIVQINPVTLKAEQLVQKMEPEDAHVFYKFLNDKLNTAHGNTNSKNLLASAIEISSAGDTTIRKYHYTFDAKGRVTSEVMESKGPLYGPKTRQEVYDSTAYTY